jgi:O-antigen ligase
MAVHHYVESQKQITLILKALLISATVVATIGILQFFGMDLFKSAFGQNLIIPEHYANLLNLISFQTDERLTNASAIYSTMLNPNTYGLYLATIFPLCLSLFLQTERISKKIALGFISCLLFGNLIGSFSRGAYIGAIISILITGMLFGQKFKMKWKRAIIILIPFVLIYLGMNFYSSGTISSKVQTLVNTTENHAEDTIIDKVKNFSIDQNSLTIHCSKTLLNLSIVDGSLKFYDDNQNILLLKTMDGKGEYEIADKKYINYELTIIDNLIKVKKGKSFLYFAIEDNEFSFLDSKGVAQKNTNIQRIGFKGLERLGSGRGYIWSRTIPILKGTIFVGTGPDTYAMAFPQNDFIGKLNYMYDANIIIDKPHNMYLQTAVNTGVLSLLSLLTIFTIYIVQFIARFKKSSQVNFYSKIGLAIFPAMLAYMLSAMFTDSTVSVAPVFWILLATGFVINKHMNI